MAALITEFHQTEDSLRFRQKIVGWQKYAMTLGLCAIGTLFGLAWWWFFLAVLHIENVALRIPIAIIFAPLVLFPLLFFFSAFVTYWAKETGELTPAGFRYTFSIFFPLRRIILPAESLCYFYPYLRAMQYPLSHQHEILTQLALKTTGGTLVMLNPWWLFWRVPTAESVMERLADAGDELLARWKHVELPATPDPDYLAALIEKPETIPFNGQSRGVSGGILPPKSRLRMRCDGQRLMFRRPAAMKMPDAMMGAYRAVFFAGIAACLGVKFVIEQDNRPGYFTTAFTLLVVIVCVYDIGKQLLYLTQPFRPARYCLTPGMLTWKDDHRVFSREKNISLADCAAIRISDEAYEEMGDVIPVPSLWPSLKPGYALKLLGRDKKTVMEITHLTRDEAHWIANEILRHR